ncbi:MAG TPA: DUF5684 domain-containing protein [Polyangiaceae bacterium]|jgi:hypothetical protein
MFSAHEVEYSSSGGGVVGIIFSLIYLAVIVLLVAGVWKTFTKAGEPGWAAIVPIYNVITILKLGGKPWYWAFIPVVGPIMMIIAEIEIAKRFGKGAGFGIGLAFLPFIFWPMLGFGSATAGAPVPVS